MEKYTYTLQPRLCEDNLISDEIIITKPRRQITSKMAYQILAKSSFLHVIIIIIITQLQRNTSHSAESQQI